jgi:hypothetical protein
LTKTARCSVGFIIYLQKFIALKPTIRGVNMSEFSNDLGIAIVLLERLTKEIIPKAKSIQERLAGGEQLDHWDRQLLEELIRDAERSFV